jgi:hypothetical protein
MIAAQREPDEHGWSVYFFESVTSGKLKGSHLFASVTHASRNRS